MTADDADTRFAELTDDVLAGRADTDPDAFAVLYRRHLNDVYRYILSRVHHEQDAQDLTTQTFMGALHGIGKYQPQGTFVACLIGIARRKIVDHFRKQKPDIALEFAERLPGNAPPVEHTVSTQLRLEAVLDSLDMLSHDRAEAIRLRLFAGLSAKEAGMRMDKSENAVNMLVYRGLNDLRKQLRPPQIEENEVPS